MPGEDSGVGRGTSVAFGMLSEGVRRFVWGAGWPGLRDVQERAIPVLLVPGRDAILCAPTAGGKTEAAFLPLLSRIDAGGWKEGEGFRIAYVSPLKALINDQFRRVSELCGGMGIPVHRWHGDVGAHLKAAAAKTPSGVVLLTPESLEAILCRRGARARAMFAACEAVVVDEVHAFPGTDRGFHLQSLLHRVELAAGRRQDRVGLSATVADPAEAAEFLRPGRGAEAALVVSGEGRGEVRAMVFGHEDGPDGEGGEEDAAGSEIAAHLLATLEGRKSLVFAGSRMRVEGLSLRLAEARADRGLPPCFSPHHGSLSREIREEGEERMRGADPHGIVCTTTLELGLDVGDVEAVAQIGPAPSVASLRQRLGRSGRREGVPSVLRVYIRERASGPDVVPPDDLCLDLARAAAQMRLVAAGWNEPFPRSRLGASVTVQQVLAVVLERGGVSPASLAAALRGSGAFPALAEEGVLASLLRAMAADRLLEQAEDGTLLLGPEGEKLAARHDFYAVFPTPREWNVCEAATGRGVGSLPLESPCRLGDRLVLGGRRWEAVSVDAERLTVAVVSARGGKAPIYTGGTAPVHPTVAAETCAVLAGEDTIPFLDAVASRLLERGRARFRETGAGSAGLIGHDGGTVILPWLGSGQLGVIRLLLQAEGVPCWFAHAMALRAAAPPDRLRPVLAAIAASPWPAPSDMLLASGEDMARAKYDRHVPEEMLSRDRAAETLDAEGVREALEWLGISRPPGGFEPSQT